jgi:hypothetical protein
MAVLTLPTSPSPRSVTPRLVSARNELTPAFGGTVQRLNRKGSRYALDVEMPPMRYADALAWDDILSETDTVLMPVPQPDLVLGAPGSPLVNGAGQAGNALAIDSLTPGYVIRKGQWFSVIANSRRYLYRASAAATANGSGQVTVGLRTMLRYPPADNAVVEIAVPMIEGFARVSDDAFMVGIERLVSLKFTIEERA